MLDMMAHTFNPSTGEEADSLVYEASSRTVRVVTQRNHLIKIKPKEIALLPTHSLLAKSAKKNTSKMCLIGISPSVLQRGSSRTHSN